MHAYLLKTAKRKVKLAKLQLYTYCFANIHTLTHLERTCVGGADIKLSESELLPMKNSVRHIKVIYYYYTNS